jgi:Family of unknown function (DUF5681)
MSETNESAQLPDRKPGEPFRPGESGNPAGRPKGSRNKTTLALEALLEGEAENITRKVIELAKAGDVPAIRLCLDRLLPMRRDRPATFEVPSIQNAEDAADFAGVVLSKVGERRPDAIRGRRDWQDCGKLRAHS